MVLLVKRSVLIVSLSLVALSMAYMLIDDLESRSAESHQLKAQFSSYKTINDEARSSVSWGALSGLSADFNNVEGLYAVNDNFYKKAEILKIDVSSNPARIVDAVRIKDKGKNAKHLDLEGIAQAPDGSFWVVSEGRDQDKRKEKSSSDNLLLQVSSSGEILSKVKLPSALRANKVKYGFEGVAVDGKHVVIAIQRPWKDDSKKLTKLAIFDTEKKLWQFVLYPLDKVKGKKTWVGLSDITAMGDGKFMVLERDNQAWDKAIVKRIYKIDLNTTAHKPYGEKLNVLNKQLIKDLIPALSALRLKTPGKLEGLAMTKSGKLFVAIDIDGVETKPDQAIIFRVD